MTKKKTSVRPKVVVPEKKVVTPVVKKKEKKIAAPVAKTKKKKVVIPEPPVIILKKVSKDLGIYQKQQFILTSGDLSNEEKATLLCELFPGSDPVQLFELMKGHDLHPYPQGWYKWNDTFWEYLEGAPK